MTRNAVQSTLESLVEADRLVVTTLLPVLSAHDLTLETFRALSLLADSDGATVGEIASRTGATPSSTTRLVDRLVERNWAYRRPAPTDRRRILLTLSDAGRALWQALADDLA